MRGFLLALLLLAISAAPAAADDAAFGHRLATCSGVLKVWGAVLKEAASTDKQRSLADEYTWKGLRLGKRARYLIGDTAFARTFQGSGRALLETFTRNEQNGVRNSVDACVRFYAKVMI